MGNCLACNPGPAAENITKKIGCKDGQITAIKFKDLPAPHWIYINHKNADGSDITLKMMKEAIAKLCKCEPQKVVCYFQDDHDWEFACMTMIRVHHNLLPIIYGKRNVLLYISGLATDLYEDGVYVSLDMKKNS